MISLEGAPEEDGAGAVVSAVKKWFHKQSRRTHVKPYGKRPAAAASLLLVCDSEGDDELVLME